MEKLKVYRAHTSPYQGDDFKAKEKERLSSLGVEYLDSPTDADVLITNTHVDLENYDLKKLKLIIHPNSGYDNFKPETIRKLNCPIVLGYEIRANAVASYILSAFFYHFVKIPFQNNWDKARTWNRPSLRELNIQLFGVGHIGTMVRDALTPIVKNVFCYDPPKNHSTIKLVEADVVIMAAELNDSSFHLLDKNKIKTLKDNVLIINAARGKLIDQNALINFLKENQNAFAFLDVFENEPINPNEFGLKNLHPSSHIAGVTRALNDDIINFSYNVIRDFINNKNSIKFQYTCL